MDWLRAKTNNPKRNPRDQGKEEIMQSQHDNQASGIAREQSVLAMLRALVPNRPLSPGETLRIAEEKGRRAKMVSVTVEISEGALTQRVQITAPSIKQVLKMAGEGKPGRSVRPLFPIDPEAFFVPAPSDTREAA
jgi:hypothetical protein